MKFQNEIDSLKELMKGKPLRKKGKICSSLDYKPWRIAKALTSGRKEGIFSLYKNRWWGLK